jgi:deferrochelatase/peroxidase EfeB
LLKDLQANILKNHNEKYAIHAFLHFYPNKVKEVKKWLSQLPLTAAWTQLETRYNNLEKPAIQASLYFTHDAYEYLNYDLRKIPESGAMPFASTPQHRFAFHKNLEEQKLPKKSKVHAMLMLAGDDKKALLGQLRELAKHDIKIYNSNKEEKAVRGKIGSLFIQWGQKKDVGPFGFIDGLSNPLFFPNPIKQSEIPDEEISKLETVLVKDPNGESWDSCGSFLAMIKFRQNVNAFEAESKKVKKATGLSLDMAKSLIIGNLHNQGLKGDIDLSTLKGCPFHRSHVQASRFAVAESGYSQITRRSIHYEDTKVNKGLLFMSFQANIGYQFEYLVNRFFMNRKSGYVDPLLYNHEFNPSVEFQFPKSDVNSTTTVQFDLPFVTMQRGWYFFAPSISSIKRLG